MELKVLSNVENNLLSRKEIVFSVVQESSTVSKNELVKELSKKLNLNPEGTIIIKLDQSFGVKQSMGLAHSYKSKDLLEKYEPKHLISRLTGKKEKKAEQPKPEPKAEEAKEKEKPAAKEEKEQK